MPCIIITGHPSSGKSSVAEKLKARALRHAMVDNVVILNEESNCSDYTKQQCYETSLAEKKTRAALKAAFDRSVGAESQKTLVILDSLNYIKGFRYELHCISKAAGERHGILWVLNQPDVCEEWNQKRSESERYESKLLRELIFRYEAPDERNRWDKPLFVVDVTPSDHSKGSDSKSEVMTKSIYNMHSLDATLPTQPKVDENVSSSTVPVPQKKKPTKSAFSRAKPKKPITNDSSSSVSNEARNLSQTSQNVPSATSSPAAGHIGEGTAGNSSLPVPKTKTLEEQLDDILDSLLNKTQPLKEGMSTQVHIAGNANALQELDSITQRMVSALATAQNSHTGGKLVISMNGMTFSMNHKRAIALAELRRLRKQYLLWVAQNPPHDTTEQGISESFLSYIEGQL